MKTLVTAVLVVILAEAGSAFAATLTVPDQYADIQTAVDSAGAGDVILIGKGVWTDPVVVDGKTQLTFLGKGKPILDGQGTHVPLRFVDCTEISLAGLTFRNSSDDGLQLDGCSDFLITKCAALVNGDDGISADDCDGIEVISCSLIANGEDGIGFSDDLVDTTDDCRVEKCKFIGNQDDAVDANGSDNVFIGNQVKGGGGDGFDFDGGTNNRFEKNKVQGIYGDGFYLESGGNILLANSVKGVGGDGVDLEGDGSELTGNKVSGCDENGFEIEGTGNVLTGNKAAKSGDQDAEDRSGGVGNNTYTENGFDVVYV